MSQLLVRGPNFGATNPFLLRPLAHNNATQPHQALAAIPGIHIRAIFTSPSLFVETRKRRKTYPFFWLQDKYRAYYDENLTPDNEEFVKNFIKSKYSLPDGSSPLKQEPWNLNEEYTETTQRTGVLARKLGTCNQWLKTGKRVICTVLQVTDNHVIKYHPPEEYQKIGRPVDRRRHEGKGCIIVGADSRDPRMFTAEYNGLFNESGIMPKKKLTRFFITHNARIEPGTPLLASHFRPGMYCDVYGKSHAWTNRGLRFAHQGLKLGRKTHGATKSHNRIGSIGRGRQWAGPKKGKTMPKWSGNERKIMPGLKVLRVNTKYNLIYLKGPGVPGEDGSYVNIMDSNLYEKQPSKLGITPPFPTATMDENSKLEEELYDEELHRPSDPSLLFEVTEEEKRAAALAARAGKAKTAQKIR